MPAFDYYNDPFAIEGLLSLPALATEPCSAWQTLNLDAPKLDTPFKTLDIIPHYLQELHTDFFHLDTADVPLPDVESSHYSTASSDIADISAKGQVSNEEHVEQYEDVWTLPDVSRTVVENKLTSWDHFLRRSHAEPRTAYLSEAGPIDFDAALARALGRTGRQIASRIAPRELFVSALFELGLGRESGLFEWDGAKGSFVRRSEEFGLLGTSSGIQDAITRAFIHTGNLMQALQAFAEENKSTTNPWQPAIIALSSAISTIVHATMQSLEQERQKTQSILQLQELFDRPRALIESLHQLVVVAKSARNKDDIISRLVLEAEQSVSKALWLEDLLHIIVSRTATPFIKSLSGVVGLGSPVIPTSAPGSAPSSQFSMGILPPELSDLASESELTLQLIQTNRPDHPILSSNSEGLNRPPLSWECSWDGIKKLQRQATEYENDLKRAIREFAQGSSGRAPESKGEDLEVMRPSGIVNVQTDDLLMECDWNPKWGRHLGIDQATEDIKLDEIVFVSLHPSTDSAVMLKPQLDESLSLSLTPLLTAQHRLLSSSVLHLLFKTHGLRSHLQLQHRFQLLGDGSFASRLSEALFDPQQSSGEGRRKGEGKTGLRLQSRDTWPPASSELRLVLMGLLAESFASDPAIVSKPRARDPALSETISFAIRDLSDAELEKCRDVDSIYALDFLCLQYKPQSTLLDAVLTPSSLEKYDRIFKHMLRVLRLKSLALDLVRSVTGRNKQRGGTRNHRLRLEIDHFVTTLAAYSATVAIGAPWARFHRLVDKVERCVERSDFDGVIHLAGGILHLRDLHEEALDSMLRSLFLDRKQAQVRTLLEDVFGTILRFAASVRNADMTDDVGAEFRKQVGRFVRYLRAHTDESTSPLSGDIGSAPAFEQLLLNLDFKIMG